MIQHVLHYVATNPTSKSGVGVLDEQKMQLVQELLPSAKKNS